MIDSFASLSHYLHHLLPIWQAIPDDQRGTFWCEPRVAIALRAAGIPRTTGRPPKSPRTVLVAGAHDVWIVRKRGPHRVVLVEHGVGQSYEGYVEDPGYSGGPRREDVALFLCPNPQSAERNLASYPDTPAVVVGSPRVDELRRIVREPQERPVVCLSFHHPGNGKHPITGWALPHYEDGLPAVVNQLREDGYEVIGHGHPRARTHFARLWKRLGIEHVQRLEDVVRRASVYVCDNSSTEIETAACGIEQVLLQAPLYPSIGAGPWWRWGTPAWWLGPSVSGAEGIVKACGSHDSSKRRGWRESAVDAVLPMQDGKAAERAVEAVLTLGQ